MKLSGEGKPWSETEIQKSILDGLMRMGLGSFNRINNAPIFDEKRGCYRKKNSHTPDGLSDVIGCYKGRYVCIEVKTTSEYRRVVKFIQKNENMIAYQPKNKWEERIRNQYLFITEKINKGGTGFFTYSLEDTLFKLGVNCEKSN